MFKSLSGLLLAFTLVTITACSDKRHSDFGPGFTPGINSSPVNALPSSQTTHVGSNITASVPYTGSVPAGSVFSVTNPPTHGTVTLNPNTGSYTYSPATGYTGPDSFSWKVNNGTNESSSVVNISVIPNNLAPLFANQTFTLNEDVPLFSILVASDPETDPLTFTLNTPPAHGTLILNPNGSFTYIPNPNFTGTDTFTASVSDGTNTTGPVVITLNVLPVNDAPVASNLNLTTNEDVVLNSNLVGTDADGNPLTYSVVSLPTNGSVMFNSSTGSFSYTPNANYNGLDSFTYKVNDGSVDSNVATVNITINSVNDIPVASNQSVTTPEDTPKAITLVGTDVESSLTYIIVTPPTHGTLSGSGANVTYTPNANYHGPDSFTFKVNDGSADSNVATVSIAVTPVNDAPVAHNLAFSVEVDDTHSGSLLGTDVDGDTLTYSLVSAPTKGTVIVNPNGSFTYDPNNAESGTDTFTYKVNDGSLDSNVATVTITLDPSGAGNNAPVASNATFSTNEDQVLNNNVSATDADGDALNYTLVSGEAHGSLTLNANGTFSYTPNTNYSGTDSFTFKANDGTSDSNVATVTITINPVNDAPVASNDSFSLNKNSTYTNNLQATDVDSVSLTYSIVTNPSHGSVSVNPGTGAYTYTPNTNYVGADSFTFKANDGSLDSNVATISISVVDFNQTPVVQNQTLTTPEDTSVSSNFLFTDDGPATNWTVSTPSKGTVIVTNPSTGAYTYVPHPNATGTDTFTVVLNDGTLNSNVATITVNITPVNDAPVASNGSFNVQQGQSHNGNLIATDVEGDSLTYAKVSNPTKGSVTVNASTGAFVYVANPGATGTDIFTFKANDGSLDSNIATITVNLNADNVAPVALSNAFNIPEDQVLNASVLATDANGDAVTYILVWGPSHGSLVVNPDGTFIYTPNPNFNGADSFTFKANDGLLDSNVATININVTPVNDAPMANNQSVSTNKNEAKNIVLNGTDIDGDAVTYTIVSGPAHGTLSGSGANVVYTPNTNYHGPDSFTYKVNDGSLDSNVATVSINVVDSNVAPVAISPTFNINEDTPLVNQVQATDGDGDTLIYTLVTPPTHGTILFNPDGTFSYLPDPNYFGPDTFTFKANDGLEDSNIGTVSINVGPINDAPYASDDSFNVQQNQSYNGNLLAVDVEGSPLTYSIVSNPTKGSVTVNASTGAFVYVANPGVTGTDTFTFKANDGSLDSNVATITVNLNADNVAPVASNGNFNINEDQVLVAGLIASDANGDSVTYAIVTNPTHGTVSVNAATGVFTYTPAANYNGPDSFTFKASDGLLDSNVATISINVVPQADAPVAHNQSVTVPENSSLPITLVGTDADGDSLTYIIVTPPANGTLSGSGANVVYTPNVGFSGSDSFTFKVNDGSLDSNVATVSISVPDQNFAPVAVGESISTNEDVSVAISLDASDSDGDVLTYIIVSAPTHGTLSGSGANLVYTPNANYHGADSFTFKVNDGSLDSNVATVSINVISVNDLSVASDDSFTTNKNQPHTDSVSSTDVDGDPLTYIIVTPPAHGTVVLNPSTGVYTYTPNTNYVGADSFTFKSNDGTADSNIATVSITVLETNVAPVSVASSFSTNEDVAYNGLLSASDANGDVLNYTIVTNPAHGTITLNAATGAFVYTPAANYHGADSFTFKANDGALDSNVSTVSIIVNSVPDAPVAYNGSFTTGPNTLFNGALNATDADGDALTYTIISQPAQGTITLNPSTGTFSYQSDVSAMGSDSFTFKVNDGSLDSNVATVSINFSYFNFAPVAFDGTFNGNEDSVISGNLLASDLNGDTLTYSVVTPPAHGTVTVNPFTGLMVYTPNPNFSGVDTFTFLVNDGTQNSNIAEVTLNVNNVNDTPVASNGSFTTFEDQPYTGSVSVSDLDPADTLVYSVVSQPTHGTVALNSSTGSYVYTPNANYNGPDSFTFKANDGSVDSNVATISINVIPQADAPVASNATHTTPEDQPLSSSVVATDADGDTLTYAIVSNPTHGTVVLNPTTGTFVYTPASNYFGPDSFTFKANDGTLDSNVATISINVTPVEDAPVAQDQNLSTNEDQVLSGNLLATDGDGDALTYSIVANPTKGSVSVNPSTGAFVYTPNSNATGSDFFTFKANDGDQDSNVATVYISISPLNDAPVAFDDSFNTNEDQPVSGILVGMDVDGDTLTYSVVSQGTKGVVSVNPSTGAFIYTPNANANGSDSFTFKVNDGTMDSNGATISININSINDAPVALNDSLSTNEDTALNITLQGSDVDGIL